MYKYMYVNMYHIYVCIYLYIHTLAHIYIYIYIQAQYKGKATISTKPTERGLSSINPFSQLFGIHYLDRKPLNEFFKGKDRTLFLRLMDAEKNGLITVTVDPPMMLTTSGWEKDLHPFLNDANLMMQMIPSVPMEDEPYPVARESWDRLRLGILETCIERYLIPSLEQEIRRDLVRIGKHMCMYIICTYLYSSL
jgi:hypothetical protein